MVIGTQDVAFTAGGNRLAGTVHSPTGREPREAVVIVHGSGAVGRSGTDGTVQPVIDHFARSGFAVLSYDKPGVGGSTGDWRAQTFDDRADETLAAVEFIRARVDTPTVGLWGISQGGWIAPMAAVRADARIAFMVLVSATPMTPYAQVTWLMEQDLRSAGFKDAEVADALAALHDRTAAMDSPRSAVDILADEVARVGDRPWYDRFRTPPEEVDFMRAIWHFDPTPVLEALRCPVWAAWGSRDLHMPAGECARLFATALARGGNPDFRLEVYPDAGHRLRPHSDPDQVSAPLTGYLRSVADWTARFVTQRD